MLYYIFHSGFVVELERNILIFDFYKFPRDKRDLIEDFKNKFLRNKNKKLTVFSSHSHLDHFNPEILEWQKENDITYIFSDDILTEVAPNIHFVKDGDVLCLNDLKLHVFSSTDEGVSFYVNVEGKNIFHPGDLHYWNWNEDTEEDRLWMKNAYINELKKVQKLEKIDLAFVLVDPRLEENVYDGVDIFFDMLKPRTMVPIHFAYDYSALAGFIDRFKNCNVHTVEIKDSMSYLKCEE